MNNQQLLEDYLKKAYFNARTDVVAEKNGVIHNSNHALPTLNNMADELLAQIEQHVLEARKDENQSAFMQAEAHAELGADSHMTELLRYFTDRINTIDALLNTKGGDVIPLEYTELKKGRDDG